MESKSSTNSSPGSVLHQDHVGDLSIVVERDGNGKFDSTLNESSKRNDEIQKNLIKGLSADESVTVNVSKEMTPFFKAIDVYAYVYLELQMYDTYTCLISSLFVLLFF